ncbi:MAG: hypothetical protein ABI623_09415 [bacterium]
MRTGDAVQMKPSIPKEDLRYMTFQPQIGITYYFGKAYATLISLYADAACTVPTWILIKPEHLVAAPREHIELDTTLFYDDMLSAIVSKPAIPPTAQKENQWLAQIKMICLDTLIRHTQTLLSSLLSIRDGAKRQAAYPMREIQRGQRFRDRVGRLQ